MRRSPSTRHARARLCGVWFAAVAALPLGIGLGFAGGEPVTIFARPTVLGWPGATTLYGSVDSGTAGENVTIQAKGCGQDDFNTVGGATTIQGGGWTYVYYPGISSTIRAVWKGEASASVGIRQRADVRLDKSRSQSGLTVAVLAKKSFWRRHTLIQRLDRRPRAWRTVKSVVLTHSTAAGLFSWSSADFNISVARGTLLRAVFPLSQARPCYLAGVSRPVRK